MTPQRHLLSQQPPQKLLKPQLQLLLSQQHPKFKPMLSLHQ